jgi:Flp pilus assembly protein TadG
MVSSMQGLSFSRSPSKRLSHLAARFARGRGGSTAVEFAMIALPFLALIMGIIEISMIYLVSTTLENATADVARKVRTGELQTSGTTQNKTTFVTAICDELTWLSSCSTNLYVDVNKFSSFSNITQTSPIKNGQVDPTQLNFVMGGPGDIVMVRAFYQWTLFTPVLDGMAATLNGGSTLIVSTAAFRNEPYGAS